MNVSDLRSLHATNFPVCTVVLTKTNRVAVLPHRTLRSGGTVSAPWPDDSTFLGYAQGAPVKHVRREVKEKTRGLLNPSSLRSALKG